VRFVTPITDRTAADIAAKTAKAYLNILDWVRIYGNAEYVNWLLEYLSDVEIEFNTLTEPTITTIPEGAGDINELLENIEQIRVWSGIASYGGMTEIKDDWFSGPAAAAPDYEDVNQWEETLEIIHEAIFRSSDYRIYCGVATAGQERFYQHRWRRMWVLPSTSPVRRSRTGVAMANAGLTRNNMFRRYD
jgi:hypothetical protein